jgi:hypothetical protein
MTGSKTLVYKKQELSPRSVCRNLAVLILVGFILRLVTVEVLGVDSTVNQ